MQQSEKRREGWVSGQNMPELGELVWYHHGEDLWSPAIWITPPQSPSWRYATVMMRGDIHAGCHFSRFHRGEEIPDGSR